MLVALWNSMLMCLRDYDFAMQAVKDSEELRKAVEETQQLQVKFGLRLSQSRPLYEGFRWDPWIMHSGRCIDRHLDEILFSLYYFQPTHNRDKAPQPCNILYLVRVLLYGLFGRNNSGLDSLHHSWPESQQGLGRQLHMCA